MMSKASNSIGFRRQSDIDDHPSGSQNFGAPQDDWDIVRTDNHGRKSPFSNPRFDLLGSFAVIEVYD
jgi:hypothetical protein